jgi:hypothetical protein
MEDDEPNKPFSTAGRLSRRTGPTRPAEAFVPSSGIDPKFVTTMPTTPVVFARPTRGDAFEYHRSIHFGLDNTFRVQYNPLIVKRAARTRACVPGAV